MKKINRKTLLYKSNVEYADYGLNHAEGCSHGCTYPCYAMILKRRCGVIKSYQEWIKPKIVENALELLDKELPKHKDKIKQVFMCFTTDPFMYQIDEVNELSLRILERLNQDNVKAVLISKGIYPKELTYKAKYGNLNEYGITLVSLSDKFQKKVEPFASPFQQRINSLRNLHEEGLKTWVSMEPYPTPNIIKQEIREILNEISFVDKIVFGRWNYNPLISSFKGYQKYFNALAEKVEDFCKLKGIECHIKEGTRISYNAKKFKTRDLRLIPDV